MSQASSWWQQLLNQIKISSLPEFKSRAFKSLFSHSGLKTVWLLGLALAIAMLFWNWKLLSATGVGVLVMWSVYRLQAWDWQLSWSNLQRFLGGANRQLTLAVGSGGLATLSTYMAVSIGVDTDSHWIAFGAMLQGLGTLATLILLVCQIVGRQVGLKEERLEQLLADLTDTDPLKRAIAVRQLTHLVAKARFDKQQHSITDYFRLMLSREPEPTVRNAVLDGLQALENLRHLERAAPALSMPVALDRHSVKVRRRTSN